MSNINNTYLLLRLKGGVGNQLFQYAFARSLSNKYGYSLIIDTKTGYYLDKFKRKPRVDDFLKKYQQISITHSLLFYITKFFPKISVFIFSSKFINELNPKTLVFLKDYEPSAKVKYLFIEGYFQSPVYFDPINDIIRNEICLFNNFNQIIEKYLIEIEESTSIAIHIRRLDYNDTLDISYYENAVNHISKKLNQPTYFIFSDDIEWCFNKFNFIEQVKFIDYHEQDELIDLYLMTKCKHFIIANSSFSWWAAYLSKNEDKIVIAPNKHNIGVENNFYPANWKAL